MQLHQKYKYQKNCILEREKEQGVCLRNNGWNVPDLGRHLASQVQEADRPPSYPGGNRPSPKHTHHDKTVKNPRQRIRKACREYCNLQRNPHWVVSAFLSRKPMGQERVDDNSKCCRKKTACQEYLVKLSFRNEEIDTFPTKAERVHRTRPSLQEMQRRVIPAEVRGR